MNQETTGTLPDPFRNVAKRPNVACEEINSVLDVGAAVIDKVEELLANATMKWITPEVAGIYRAKAERLLQGLQVVSRVTGVSFDHLTAEPVSQRCETAVQS